MLLNCWLLTANFFAKSLPLKNVFLSFFELKIEAHLVFLSGILRRIYSAFSLLEVLIVRQLCKEKEATTNFSQCAGRMIWNFPPGDHYSKPLEFLT